MRESVLDMCGSLDSTVLFDEVKSVETQEELRNIERAVKGRADIVLAQLPMLGLPEHRAVMEAAFVYGAKHQFVLTKGGSLERLGIEDPDSPGSHLWFLHCREVLRQSDPCQHTTLKKPLTTLNVYTFLQLMETPLVTEASVDPSDVKTVGSHLHAPLLFLFSQRETLALDRVTAETLGWRLRGEVAVVLIHREDTVQEEEEDIDEDWAVLDVLDDEVVESVYRDRDVELDVGLVTELTSDTFSKAVQESNTAVVLFFVRWDAASLAVMQSFKEVADALEDIADVQLACVDCGEWTDVCSSQLIAAFPTVRMYWSGGLPHTYTGMLGTESLLKYIMLQFQLKYKSQSNRVSFWSLAAAPVLLSSSQEVQSFLQGDLFHTQATLSPTRVVGLLSSSQDSGCPMFEGAAQALRGETLLGLFADQQAEQWAKDHNVKLPAILVFRAPDSTIKAHSLQLSSTEQLVSDIQKLLLDTFFVKEMHNTSFNLQEPELTVENLPLYLELRKPLLLLFLGPEGDEEQGQGLDRRGAREELHRLADTSLLDTYVPCWVHLSSYQQRHILWFRVQTCNPKVLSSFQGGRTPAGRAVLESYLGSIPQLPALVLSQLASGGEVFHFPSESPLNSDTVLQWLHRVERKEEQPAGLVLDEKWGPSVPFYDFLSIMDQEVPGYAAQKTPKMTKNMVGEKGSDEEPGHSNRTPSTKKHMPQQEVPTSHQHSEF
ncbi:thioredoxin domain-containing protein 16-like [Scleropages formosus]|uniref:Thioredoxin domain-containing protein 16-like n=1 Tax=Scleropages formosus TaxID=113540 RepID=A0A0N8JWA0_SCLFO|nr:thioredoxin domain-containing protein 16-like [Scleropages formosus]